MPGFETVNSKVVKAEVQPGRELIARRGAMLAYTGQVAFRPIGNAPGPAGMLGRALSGESAPMMVAEGAGEVFYGYQGLHVTLVQLDGTQSMSVEADRLMVHDASLQTSVVFLGQQGGFRDVVRGAMTGQGLFTTQLSGAGSVAVLAHGGTIALPVTPGAAVAVDPQAYVGHIGAVDIAVSASVGWRDAVGKGSGEAFQLKVTGTGTVYVQASEQKF